MLRVPRTIDIKKTEAEISHCCLFNEMALAWALATSIQGVLNWHKQLSSISRYWVFPIPKTSKVHSILCFSWHSNSNLNKCKRFFFIILIPILVLFMINTCIAFILRKDSVEHRAGKATLKICWWYAKGLIKKHQFKSALFCITVETV